MYDRIRLTGSCEGGNMQNFRRSEDRVDKSYSGMKGRIYIEEKFGEEKSYYFREISPVFFGQIPDKIKIQFKVGDWIMFDNLPKDLVKKHNLSGTRALAQVAYEDISEITFRFGYRRDRKPIDFFNSDLTDEELINITFEVTSAK